jgi:hypothetical protein
VIIAPAPEPFAAAQIMQIDGSAPIVASVTTEDGRHILLDDPDGQHQLWFVEGVIPQPISFLIPFDSDFGARLHSLQRLHRRLAGERAGPLLKSLQLTLLQRAGLTLQLRALDGDLEGTSRREIAAVLLDSHARDIPAIEWKNTALRKRINRIIARAKVLMNGGYLALLRGEPQRASRFRRR